MSFRCVWNILAQEHLADLCARHAIRASDSDGEICERVTDHADFLDKL